MIPDATQPRRLAAIARAVAGTAVLAGLLVTLAAPADAQLFERRQRPPDVFNPFRIFTPMFQREPRDTRGRRAPVERRQQAAPVDHSKAPPPQKSEATPGKHIVVMGTSLSDWLAYGLEDIYSDRPDVGIVRKNQLLSGLVRFDSKDETTWPQVARDFLKDQNPDVIVVLFGLEDRIAIRERAAKREAGPQGEAGQPKVAAPESRRQATQSVEFRSDQWAELYQKRIDEMIAVLKSKGAPVIWVGLPAIRGTRSTSDMIYLNDLFRARAERAGITYVDVWDGFVDESGRFTTFGPDVEGQVRRLRSAEGVYFTKYGASKLAHYVEREIKRVMGTRVAPMAIPTLDDSRQPVAVHPGEPARPVAGPTVSLTNAANADELLGGGARPSLSDPLAARVLVKGTAISPPSGRADNFFLTPEAAAEAAKAAAAVEAPTAATALTAVAPAATPAASASESILADEPKSDSKDEPKTGASGNPEHPARKPVANAARPAARTPANQPAAHRPRPTPPRDIRAVERRPQQRRPDFDPLGLFR